MRAWTKCEVSPTVPDLAKPAAAKITRVAPEADGVWTIYLRYSARAEPGQFVMVWIPGLDEKPFAVSVLDEEVIGITVAAVGPFSNALSAMGPGERVGVRGPYGAPYRLDGRRIVMVGGGYGSASLALLVEHAVADDIDVTFILGARTAGALVFRERLIGLLGEERLIVTTDDGSTGRQGMVTGPLTDLLANEQVDTVFACGPDRMLKAVADLCVANGVPGQISLERWMKCGFGLCGHCSVDPFGIRVCTEGPVVSADVASRIAELGNYHRVKSSRKEPV